MGRVTALRIPCGLGRALGRDTDEFLIDEICCVSARKQAHCIAGESYKVGSAPSVGSKGYLAIFRAPYLYCHPRLLISFTTSLLLGNLSIHINVDYKHRPTTSPQWQRTFNSAFTTPMATGPMPTQNQTPATQPPQSCINRSSKACPTTSNATKPFNESSAAIQPARTLC